ncbi:hypothetical protein DIPPA_07343 [Diplonema papillatum]|nr:hypothetical protein DIPPA_07343 [Diplonema papillatum]
MDEATDVWLCGQALDAHKGAAITAVSWLGERDVFGCGDDDGKIGVWKLADVVDTARKAVLFPIEGSEAANAANSVFFTVTLTAAIADDALAAYNTRLQEELSKAVSRQLLLTADPADLRAHLVSNQESLPPGFNPAETPAADLLPEVLRVPTMRPVPPGDVHVILHKKLTVQLGVKIAPNDAPVTGRGSAEVASALGFVLGRGADQYASLKEAAQAERGSFRQKEIKCVGHSRSHTGRFRITGLASGMYGQVMYSASMDGTLKVWDVTEELVLRRTIVFTQPLMHVAALPQSSEVIVAQGDVVSLLHSAATLPVSSLDKKESPAHALHHLYPVLYADLPAESKVELQFTPPQSSAGGASQELTQQPRIAAMAVRYLNKVATVAISPDGSHVAAVVHCGRRSEWKYLCVWNARTTTAEAVIKLERLATESYLQYLGAAGGTQADVHIGFGDGLLFDHSLALLAGAEAPSLRQVGSAQQQAAVMQVHPSAKFVVACHADGAVRLLPLHAPFAGMPAGERAAKVAACRTTTRVRRASVARVRCCSFRILGDYALLGGENGSLSLLQCNRTLPRSVVPQGLLAAGAGEPAEEDQLALQPTQDFPQLTQYDLEALVEKSGSQNLAMHRLDTQAGPSTMGFSQQQPMPTFVLPSGESGSAPLLNAGPSGNALPFDEVASGASDFPRVQSDVVPRHDEPISEPLAKRPRAE